MKKLMLILSVVALNLSAFAGEKVVEYALPEVKAELIESIAWPGKYMIDAEGLLQPDGPLGSPMLPYKTLTFAIPSGYDFKEVKVEATWEILSEKVKVLPVQKPVPVSENPEKPEYVDISSNPTSIINTKVDKITGLDVVIVGVTPFKYDVESGRLEVAKDLKLSVIFTEKPRLMSSFSTSPSTSTSTTSPLVHPDYLASTLSTLVNPDDAAPKAQQLMAAAAGTAVDYLMVSPPDLYETWKWYIGERKKNHPTLTFDIINTKDAYDTYPFKGWNGTTSTTYANAAESLHAYLTQYSEDHALKYVVLGGSWFDVASGGTRYLQDGTEINLNTAIPSIYAEAYGGRVPTDLFYACVTRSASNTGHPWDPNGDGHYLGVIGSDAKNPEHNESNLCNLTPDFAVSRMTMKPITVGDNVEINPEFDGSSRILNQQQLIRNFLYKVNRAEGKGIIRTRIVDSKEEYDYAEPHFRGNFKMGLTSSPLTYGSHNMSDRLVRRDELEFFDNIPNMYDPNHGGDFRDVGPITRRHASEIMAPRHPIIDAIGFHEPDIVSHNSTKGSFYNDFYNYDRETGSNNGHGWAGGSSMFNATMFATKPGLTKINVVGISCETGYPDAYGQVNGKSVANLCLGEAGMANPTATGGIIASMNNTRVGLCPFETVELSGSGFGLSYRTHYYMCLNIASGQNAGDAWKNMCKDFISNQMASFPATYKNPVGENLYPLLISMLYGDPLIKIADTDDYTWNGGSSGTWDMTSENWTKGGNSSTFYHANNITFNVAGGATITMVPNTIEEELGKTELPYGGMTMNVTQDAGSTFELNGTSSLRLMKDLNVLSGTLKLGVSGGVGLGGINFTNPGSLILSNTNEGKSYYFINKVQKASSITFAGGGAILNTDCFDSTLTSLNFEGPDNFNPRNSSPNVIRANSSRTTGCLKGFLPFNIRNIALTLETYDAFNGFTGETLATLNNSVLTFRQNRWRGLGGYTETINKKLVMIDSTLAVDATSDFYLNAASMDMSGNCDLLTTNGGKFNLVGTTTIHLNEGAVCRLDAVFNAGTDGKLVFTGSGRVIVGNADGLTGTIRIEEGVTLEMEKLPLSNLKRLEFADGTTIVLPYEEGNFYQVVPIASAMPVEGTLTVKVKDGDVESEIIAESTQTGTIFQSGTLLEWVSAAETWTSEKTFKPWRKNGQAVAFDPTERVYFPDIAGGRAEVALATSIESPFTCFANSTTRYTFVCSPTAPNATLTFDSLVIGGWTHFALPLTFHTRLYVAGGDFEGTSLVSPVVEIAAGGVFEAEDVSAANATPCLVTVTEGGRFTLTGSHKMKLILEKGAYLKAESNKQLNWNETTEITWPEDGSKVKINVSEWTPTATPTPIISGVGYTWTMQDLRKLEVDGNSCSLAVVNGALCLVKSDGIASPYTMSVNSATLNWDEGAWSGNGTAFGKKWSESFLDWTADGVITVNTDGAVLTLDKPAHFNTLKFVSADESVKNFTFTIAEGGELKVNELHLEGFENVTLNNVELDTGVLYTTTETHIRGTSSGSLMVGASDKVYIYEPSEKWVLCEGSQGAIYVAITDRAKASRQKVLTISEDSMWPIGGLDMQIFNPNGSTDNFFISREGEFVYLVPPAIHASVPTGETNWTELTWLAYDESVVTIENWDDVYAARLEAAVDGATVIVDAAPTTQFTIGPASGVSNKLLVFKAMNDASVKLPGELTMNGPAKIEGDIFPALDNITGSGKLTLNTGATTTLTLNGNISPVESGEIEVKAGSRFVIHHTQYFSSTTVDWSWLKGDGEVEIIGDNNCRFMAPIASKMFASTLSLELHSELELQADHKTNPMKVSNLSGAGILGFGSMTANMFMEIMNKDNAYGQSLTGTRQLLTTQSRVSEWSGTVAPLFSFFNVYTIDVMLTVAGSEPTPSIDRRLIYSGNANSTHTLNIASSGCVELNGYWNGDINNNGLLIMGRNGRINGNGNLKGSGAITAIDGVIDLTTYPNIANYKLYSGTTGSIKFNVSAFDTKTKVMSVQNGFTIGSESLTMVAIDPNGDRRWKAVTMDDIENGELFWKTEGADAKPLVFDLAAGANDFTALVEDAYLGGVSAITFNGNASGDSSVALTDQFRQFTGSLVVSGGVTLTGLTQSIATLASNPVGKLVFTVQDVALNQDLIQLADGFDYDPEKLFVEVVGPNGETNSMGTWTTSNGKLVYRIVNVNAPTFGLKFDANYNSWGNHSVANLGGANSDVFAKTRDGYGVKADKDNKYADKDRLIYLGGNDWTFAWCARLGTNQNSTHFSIGELSDAGGIALTTVDANEAAISRWKGNMAAEDIITGSVMSATDRFHSYAVTYRKGLYTFYIDGKQAGTSKELEGATSLPASVKWQFFSVHGGNPGNMATSNNGVLDDVRAYDIALTSAAIQALADEFPAWPDAIETVENEIIECDVNEFGGEDLGNIIYLSGDGTLRLVGSGEAYLNQIADAAKLIIADGVTVRVAMGSSNPEPLKGHEVLIEHGGRLIFEHADNLANLKDCDLSNITGEGTVEFLATKNGAYIYPPTKSFAETLSFCNNTTIYLDARYDSADTPFAVRNLSGAGTFRYDAPSQAKFIKVTQTERTTFTGAFPLCGNVAGNITLTITSLDESADVRNALTLTPSDSKKLVKVIVVENGCLGLEKNSALGGDMGAEITDNGLVVFAPPSNQVIELNTFYFKDASTSKIALNGNGTLKIKLNSNYILASNPVGIIDASGTESATGVLKLIHVVDGFEFSKATFRVAGALLDKELAVSEGWLCAAANAAVGGTAWATESGSWTASSFNNGSGTTSGSAVSFDDAVSTTSGGLVSEVTVTVNEAVACSQMNFNSTLSSYAFTGSGSIDCATISLAAGVAPITLSGVALAQETIELIVPSSVAIGTRIISWTTQYSNTFTSASLAAAGLTLEKREDGLYVVEQPANLEDGILYQFSTENTTYDAKVLTISPSPMTIACSLKTADPYTANTEIWAETLSSSNGMKIRIGLETGDSATAMKFFFDYVGTKSYPCGEIEVPFANMQTHTYVITFDSTLKVWKLYVDGVGKGVSSTNQSAFLYNGITYNYTHAQTTNENVVLQDGRIYSRILNASEIKAYVKEFPKTPSLRRPPRIIVR